MGTLEGLRSRLRVEAAGGVGGGGRGALKKAAPAAEIPPRCSEHQVQRRPGSSEEEL